MADGGSGFGGSNKVAALLIGTAAGLLAIFGPPLLDDDDEPEPEPEPVPVESVIAVQPADSGAPAPPTTVKSPAVVVPVPVATKPPADDLRGDPNNVILTIVAYGMPARVSARPTNPNATVRERVREVCIPDTQFPNPCITDYVVPKGTEVVVTAGDSLSGYWSSLDSVTGGGCTIAGGTGRDQTCTFTVLSDIELEARYYGSDSTAPKFLYPACPPRAQNPPAWLSRCPK